MTQAKTASSAAAVAKGGRLSMLNFFPNFVQGRANWIKGISVPDQVPFTPGMYLEIQPFKSEQGLVDALHLTVEDVVSLSRDGIIYPYLNAYLNRYEELDWIDPILKLKPPTYVRFAGFFNVVGNGAYYPSYMEGVSMFRGQLDDHQAMSDWMQTYHRAERAFEYKVAFDYARVKILAPERLRLATDGKSRYTQAEEVLLLDAQLVDPYTTAFEGQYRFDPTYAGSHSLRGTYSPLDPSVAQLIVDEFRVRYPRDITVDELRSITRDQVWQRGRRLMDSLQKAVEQRAETVGDRALALPSVWSEVAEALEANRRRARALSSWSADVSLGILGAAAAMGAQSWDAFEYVQGKNAAVQDTLRPALERAMLLGKQDHVVSAWRYERALRRALL